MLAHTTFALPTITATVGILEWSIKRINDIHIKTRKILKILTMTGSLHPNNNVDKLTLIEKRWGKGGGGE